MILIIFTMEKGKKFVRKHYEVPEYFENAMKSICKEFPIDSKILAFCLYNLGKHDTEELHQLISWAHKEKYRQNRKSRLLGDESKACGDGIYQDVLNYFVKNDRLHIAVEIQGIDGPRESDVIEITKNNIDFDEHKIRIYNHKSEEWYSVPMNDELEKDLKEYIEKYSDEIDSHSGYILFSNAVVRSSEHISEGWLRRNVAKAMQETGHWKVYAISSDGRELHKYTDHSLRGHAATQVLKKSHDMQQVQKLLDHKRKSIESTMVYVEDSEDGLFKTMRE